MIGYDEFRERQRSAREQGRRLGIGMAFELTPEAADIPGTLRRRLRHLDGEDGPVRQGHGADGRHDAGLRQRHGDRADRRRRARRAISTTSASSRATPTSARTASATTPGARWWWAATRRCSPRATSARSCAKVAAFMLEGRARTTSGSRRSASLESDPGERRCRSRTSRTRSTRSRSRWRAMVEPPLEATRVYKPDNITTSPTRRAGSSRTRPTRTPSTSPSSRSTRRPGKVDDRARSASSHDCGDDDQPDVRRGPDGGRGRHGRRRARSARSSATTPTGSCLSNRLKTYLMPRALDLPAIEMVHQVTPSPFTILGVKGAGEAGVGGAPGGDRQRRQRRARAARRRRAEDAAQPAERPRSDRGGWGMIKNAFEYHAPASLDEAAELVSSLAGRNLGDQRRHLGGAGDDPRNAHAEARRRSSPGRPGRHRPRERLALVGTTATYADLLAADGAVDALDVMAVGRDRRCADPQPGHARRLRLLRATRAPTSRARSSASTRRCAWLAETRGAICQRSTSSSATSRAALEPGELLTAIVIPVPGDGSAFGVLQVQALRVELADRDRLLRRRRRRLGDASGARRRLREAGARHGSRRSGGRGSGGRGCLRGGVRDLVGRTRRRELSEEDRRMSSRGVPISRPPADEEVPSGIATDSERGGADSRSRPARRS